jgi:hypothetical protein
LLAIIGYQLKHTKFSWDYPFNWLRPIRTYFGLQISSVITRVKTNVFIFCTFEISQKPTFRLLRKHPHKKKIQNNWQCKETCKENKIRKMYSMVAPSIYYTRQTPDWSGFDPGFPRSHLRDARDHKRGEKEIITKHP